MRSLILTALLIITGAVNTYSQCGIGPRKQLAMTIDLGAIGSLSNKGMRMNAYNVDLNFSTGGKLSVIGSFEFADIQLKQDGVKSYLHNMGLAGGLSYRFLTQKHFQLQALGKAGSSIGHADWKNNYYDVSLRLIPTKNTSGSHVLLGLGYRYVNSHENTFANHGFVYASIGFGL